MSIVPAFGHSTFDCTIRAKVNGEYVSAELGDPAWLYGVLRARSRTAGAWEQFQCVAVGTRQWAIRSRANGRYISAELGYPGALNGALRARATSIGSWERFTLTPISTCSCEALTGANGRYVSVELANPGSMYALLRAQATRIGAWEALQITSVPPPLTWELVALRDGSPRIVFGMQETAGMTVHEAVSNNAITGTVVGTGMTLGAPGPGTRRAGHSAGTGFIQVANAPSMQVTGTQMSYEVIAKSDESSPTNWMTVQDFATPSNDLNLHGYAMYANGGGGPNTISIELFTNNQGGNNPIRQAFPLTWDTNWHDWTWVLNVANGESWIRLYRDGVLIGGPRPLGMTYTLSANVHPMILFGAWNAAATTLQDWHGSIAGYALYATALTQTQITARYNAIYGRSS